MADDGKRPNGTQLFSAAVRAAALLLFLGLTTWVVLRYYGHIWRVVTHPDELQEWVASYGRWGPLVFLGVQILQIVVFVIPGEVVQVAGGYLFGAWVGVGYCLVGAVIGAFVVFLAAKWLGRPFVRCLVKPEQFSRLENILNHRTGIVTVFVLFLIPGIPKDVLCYVAGLTPMRLVLFLVVSTVARLPGMVLSTYIGRGVAEKSYIQLAILSGLACVMLVLGLVFQKRIEVWLSRRKAQDSQRPR